MTNREWLNTLPASDLWEQMKWIVNDRSRQTTSARTAIPIWLEQEHTVYDCSPSGRSYAIETNMYNEEETIPNCTVQIWRNSVTGEESVGWWRGKKEDMPQ